jgi:cobalt-zinc-cadmium efflux system outer membrane protein
MFRSVLCVALMAAATKALPAETPRPAPSLDALVAEALAHNPEIRAAGKRVEAARQRPSQQNALPDPTFSAGWNSNGNPLPGAGLGMEPTSNLGVMMSQEFPAAGKRRLRAEVAGKQAEAELQEYRRTQLNVISRLKQAFFRLHHSYVMDDLLTANSDLLRNLLSITEARYSVGKAMQQDVFKAQTQLSVLQVRILQVRRERSAREAEIDSLLARRPGTPVGRPPDEAMTMIPVSLEQLEAAAASGAPELKRDEKNIERAETALNLSRRDYYPDYTLNAGYYNMGTMPAMYMFRADIRVPLWFTHKQHAELAEQYALAAEARHTYEATSDSLLYRIHDDYLLAQTAAQLLEAYEKTIIPQARYAAESALGSYETGAVDFTTVLANYMAVLEYEMDYHEQMQDYHIALARLEEMTGVDLTSEGKP